MGTLDEALALAGRSPFGLLGRTLGHSWSPAIHRELGSWPYDLFEVEPDDVEAFVRRGAWRGLNVTIPYKLDAARLADEATGRVRETGAANTLVKREDGSILAENTDVLGFAWLLGRFCERHLGANSKEALAGQEVLVLGSGGASRAVCCALGSVGARPVVVSRRGPETYEGLAARHAGARLVVNTTPVGMYPHCPASPLAAEELARLAEGGLAGVVDIVYNPERTGIVLDGERLGIPAESGLAMLVAQALRSSELFQGRDLDEALVSSIEASLRARERNVVFIGMPGAGKTSTGRALAHQLRRPFVDLDEAIRLDCGVSPADIIREQGEEAFRRVETETVAKYGARSGTVVACGGGVVTRPENYPLLHQNGTIVLVERPLEELSSAGRPISAARGVEALARERGPLYRAWADVTLSCTGTPSGDAREVARLLGL